MLSPNTLASSFEHFGRFEKSTASIKPSSEKKERWLKRITINPGYTLTLGKQLTW